MYYQYAIQDYELKVMHASMHRSLKFETFCNNKKNNNIQQNELNACKHIAHVTGLQTYCACNRRALKLLIYLLGSQQNHQSRTKPINQSINQSKRSLLREKSMKEMK
jgi:hypothetical protein